MRPFPVIQAGKVASRSAPLAAKPTHVAPGVWRAGSRR